jgi:hypothetical protein
MLIKYFKRKDIFKIIKNIDFLFQSHVNLLLFEYDTIDWGAWETKIKKCVPTQKQEHLLAYYTIPDFDLYKKAIISGFQYFNSDAKEIFNKKGLTYNDNVASSIMAYFMRELG